MNKGQGTFEYIVLILIIIGALISVQIFIKRQAEERLDCKFKTENVLIETKEPEVEKIKCPPCECNCSDSGNSYLSDYLKDY